MIANQLYEHPECDWLLFTDDDSYINTGLLLSCSHLYSTLYALCCPCLLTDPSLLCVPSEWLHLPLDVYVEDVPPEKVLVMGNFRSAQSNALFIRNSEEGRAFAIDWLGVVMSGYVHCHGFDQVQYD